MATAVRAPHPDEAARARERFAAIAAGPDEAIDVAEAALWLAAEACGGLDVAAERARIDALAADVRRALPPDASREQRIDAVNRTLFDTHGFEGERVDYYDPANSFLNLVLDRRCGIPITLCVLYVTVARASGLRADGVSFPGHFLAKVGGVGEPDVLIDAFEGRRITEEECRVRLRSAFGPDATLSRDMLRAASNKEILLRMLSNLKAIYLNARRFEEALACCDRALLLFPGAPGEHRDRGLVYQQLDFIRPAVRDLERYVELAPSDDPGLPAVVQLLETLRRRMPPVH